MKEDKVTKRYVIVEHYRDSTPGFKEHDDKIIFQSDTFSEISKEFSKYKDYISGFDEYSYYVCDFQNNKNIDLKDKNSYSKFIFKLEQNQINYEYNYLINCLNNKENNCDIKGVKSLKVRYRSGIRIQSILEHTGDEIIVKEVYVILNENKILIRLSDCDKYFTEFGQSALNFILYILSNGADGEKDKNILKSN